MTDPKPATYEELRAAFDDEWTTEQCLEMLGAFIGAAIVEMTQLRKDVDNAIVSGASFCAELLRHDDLENPDPNSESTTVPSDDGA